MSGLAWVCQVRGSDKMAASRIIILGVAVAAAGGAGYVAKNMMAAPPPEVIVEQGPQTPSIELAEVLVLTGDVPMGAPVGDQLAWQAWPADGLNENFITRAAEPGGAREVQGRGGPHRHVQRRAAAQVEADRRRPELHVVDPAVGQARDRHADRGRHLGRRLHPAERLCRRHHDAPLRHSGRRPAASSPRRS